jgi:ATP-dependent helicase/DNAse subunit B
VELIKTDEWRKEDLIRLLKEKFLFYVGKQNDKEDNKESVVYYFNSDLKPRKWSINPKRTWTYWQNEGAKLPKNKNIKHLSAQVGW